MMIRIRFVFAAWLLACAQFLTGADVRVGCLPANQFVWNCAIPANPAIYALPTQTDTTTIRIYRNGLKANPDKFDAGLASVGATLIQIFAGRGDWAAGDDVWVEWTRQDPTGFCGGITPQPGQLLSYNGSCWSPVSIYPQVGFPPAQYVYAPLEQVTVPTPNLGSYRLAHGGVPGGSLFVLKNGAVILPPLYVFDGQTVTFNAPQPVQGDLLQFRYIYLAGNP